MLFSRVMSPFTREISYSTSAAVSFTFLVLSHRSRKISFTSAIIQIYVLHFIFSNESVGCTCFILKWQEAECFIYRKLMVETLNIKACTRIAAWYPHKITPIWLFVTWNLYIVRSTVIVQNLKEFGIIEAMWAIYSRFQKVTNSYLHCIYLFRVILILSNPCSSPVWDYAQK